MFIYFPAVSTVLFRQMPFPFISLSHAVVPFVTTTSGAVLFLLTRIFSGEESKSLRVANITLQVIFVVLCCCALTFASTKHHHSHTHPIDLLIHQANVQFERFSSQAGASLSLGDAVREYQRRYSRHPPP